MERNSKQLKARLVELRNAIKRKYRAFKDGVHDTDVMLEKQYKPIIKELRKNTSTNVKTEQETVKKEEEEVMTDDDDLEFFPQTVSTPKDLSDLASTPSKLASTTQFVNTYFKNRLTRKFMTSFIKDASDKKTMDHIYGPRYEQDTLMIGGKKLDFDNSGNIKIGDTNYGASEGLYELLFKRIPDEDLYTDDDLKTYKSILIATNAHKKNYDFNSNLNRNPSLKYKNIIQKLFPVRGKGMTWKSAKTSDIVHWDDPNELVDRLSHITMSTEAGNGGHSNEIINIVEELKEAGYIKGPGNSRFKALLK